MTKRIIIAATIALAGACALGNRVVNNVPASGGSGRDFSDDFNRGNSTGLGANWTIAAGSIDVGSNVADLKTVSYGKMLAIYSAQGTDGADQYVEFEIPTYLSSTYPEFIFRYTNSSSAYYALQLRITESQVRWLHYTSVASGSTQIAEATSITSAQGDTWVVTIAGTGDDTVLRMWRNPGTSYDRDRDTPASLNGNTTPTVTFTTNPASPVNSGAYVGFGGYQNSTSRIKIDNFKGGDAN